MKIFSAAQIRACDAYTIHAERITSLALMERAATACTEWLTVHFSRDTPFIVLCGTGNNGGDGLAVTRMLHQSGYEARAFQLALSDSSSPDCSANAERLTSLAPGLLQVLQPDTYVTDIPQHAVVVDALFGTGLNRPLQGWGAGFIRHINMLPNRIVAIDIPSGMHPDTITGDHTTVIHADYTLSFQFYKRVFLHEETGRMAGDIQVLDIGLNQTFIQATHTNYNTLAGTLVKDIFKPREPFGHKGTYGTALLIGGSYGMIGAVALSVQAALRSGAGKVKSLVPECGYQVLQTLTPEALCMTSGNHKIEQIDHWEDADAIGIGPGIGMQPETFLAFEKFLNACKEPLVIDADALNMIAERKKLLHHIPPNSILTPHPKEFERIFGTSGDSMLRLEQARTQAMLYNVIIVLKGRYTAVITPEGECYYNITGNAGLAAGGTGDVLTGMLTALLAQKYEPVQAAMLGVYLHGLAADKALQEQSMESLKAGDVANYLGEAFKFVGDSVADRKNL